jgi:hypothetical protein
MKREERWILEAAVTFTLPIRALTSDHLEALLNRGHHGLDPTGVANTLRHLLRENLIVLAPREGEARLDDEEELRQLVEVAYRGRLSKTTYYELTAAGGAAWEQVARPNWERYIDASFRIDPDEGEVICADPARAEWYAFSPHQESAPLADSIRRDRLEPWPATYWKTLPVGHRIRFRYDSERPVHPEYGSDAWDKRIAWMDEANDWFAPDQ